MDKKQVINMEEKFKIIIVNTDVKGQLRKKKDMEDKENLLCG